MVELRRSVRSLRDLDGWWAEGAGAGRSSRERDDSQLVSARPGLGPVQFGLVDQQHGRCEREQVRRRTAIAQARRRRCARAAAGDLCRCPCRCGSGPQSGVCARCRAFRNASCRGRCRWHPSTAPNDSGDAAATYRSGGRPDMSRPNIAEDRPSCRITGAPGVTDEHPLTDFVWAGKLRGSRFAEIQEDSVVRVAGRRSSPTRRQPQRCRFLQAQQRGYLVARG